MPLYEYQCDQCGRFETIRKFSDPPLEACPTCGKAVQKLLSSPAIQFKGTGWYITDYARKSSGEGSTSSSASAPKSESSSESSSKTETGAASTSSSTGTSGKSDAKS